MDAKFDKLFDKIVMESKQFSKKHSIIEEARKKASAQLSIEQKKANFEAIAKKVDAAFAEYSYESSEGIEEFEGDGEDNPSMEIMWQWVNKNDIDESLQLYIDLTTGEATYSDNGGIADLDLTDVEGTAKYLIDEYLFNPEYGGIGCEDRTLDEVVPELIEQWKNDGEHNEIDWDAVDADEFIDDYYDYGFETEDDIA